MQYAFITNGPLNLDNRLGLKFKIKILFENKIIKPSFVFSIKRMNTRLIHAVRFLKKVLFCINSFCYNYFKFIPHNIHSSQFTTHTIRGTGNTLVKKVSSIICLFKHLFNMIIMIWVYDYLNTY